FSGIQRIRVTIRLLVMTHELFGDAAIEERGGGRTSEGALEDTDERLARRARAHTRERSIELEPSRAEAIRLETRFGLEELGERGILAMANGVVDARGADRTKTRRLLERTRERASRGPAIVGVAIEEDREFDEEPRRVLAIASEVREIGEEVSELGMAAGFIERNFEAVECADVLGRDGERLLPNVDRIAAD